MWLGGNLTSVSYKASWQNNQIVKLYTSSLDNGQGQLDFSITNIPYGEHHLEVYASCGVIIFGSSQPFHDSNEQSLDFTATVPIPTPTPTPTIASTTTNTSTVFKLNSEQTVITAAIITAVAVIPVAFYRRHQINASHECI
jgi:hypothetical protein